MYPQWLKYCTTSQVSQGVVLVIECVKDKKGRDEYYLVDLNTGASLNLATYIDPALLDGLSIEQIEALAGLYQVALDDVNHYQAVEGWLAERYEKVEPLDFYRYLFPVGSFERKGHPEDEKPNGLAMIVDRKNRARTLVVNDGLETIEHLQGNRFAFMSPIGYIGKSRKADNARQIYAMTYDLDGVTLDTLWAFWNQYNNEKAAPMPTWIIHSGHGVHLYYQFEEPIAAYPNYQKALRELKYRLYNLVWNPLTSIDPHVQKQGITQGFRIVGTGTKLGKEYPVTAYRVGVKVTTKYLMSFIPKKPVSKELKPRSYYEYLFQPYGQSDLTLQQAKELYPDWYARKIEGTGQRQTWHIKRDLYDWWLNRIKTDDDVVVGNRYFCLMMLAVYARKCDIEEEELVRDALSLVPFLDAKKDKPEDAFTEDDAMQALNAYADSYSTFPRRDIERLSGLSVPKNETRKGRKQADHLRRARATQLADYPNFEWRNKEGRPKGSKDKKPRQRTKDSRAEQIKSYAKKHPNKTQQQIADALGVSRKTVNKWLKIAEE